MPIPDGFNDPPEHTRAFYRALAYLQEHNRNIPSLEAITETLPTNPPSRDDLELHASQQHQTQIERTEEALTRLQEHVVKMRAEESRSPNANPDDDLAQIEQAERRAALRRQRDNPVNSRRIRRRPEIIDGHTDLVRHQRRCSICAHPDRDLIDEAFLQWRRPGDIRLEFNLPGRTCIYRHAHAFGLFEKRARKVRFALGAIIEEAENVTVTADSVIRAVRAFCCIDDQGRWTDPTRRVIFSREVAASPPLPPGREISIEPAEPESALG